MSISQDERERAVFCNRRMYQTDLQSDLATAEDRGKKIGKEQGIVAGKTKVARNALRKKMPINDIVDITGLTYAEVEALRTDR